MAKHGRKDSKAPRELLTARLRKLEAREGPKALQFVTSVALHGDGNHMVAGFVMGGGFTLEVAQELARRCNAHEDLLAALERAAETLGRAVESGFAWAEAPARAAEAALAKAKVTP